MEREVEDSLRLLLQGAGTQGPTGVLLAVSGGPDSVALLWTVAACAPRLRLRLEVAWVDHGLRPEAAGEGRLVAGLAARLGLPFHARAVDVGHEPGLEARARLLREQALEDVRAARGLDLIATGHTASDQAETLLMRLARGSSLKGAAGVLPRKGRFIRPLLGVTRAQVEAYLARQGLPWARDAMNEDPAFLRVRVRSRVLPALEEAAGPGVAERLARFAAFAREDAELLDAQAEVAAARLTVVPGSLDAVGVRALLPPLRRRVVTALLVGAGVEVDAGRLGEALAALERGGRAEVGGGLWLEAAGGLLRLVRAAPPGAGVPAAALLHAAGGDEQVETPGGWQVGWSAREPGVPLRLQLPRELPRPLTVRTRRPGDRVRRPGGRSRRLQDVLVDARIPREQRDGLPVVTDARGQVLWVPGVTSGTGGDGGGWLWALPSAPASDRRQTAL